MLEYALKAKLPIISVVTDDILNYKAVIEAVSGCKVAPLPKAVTMLGAGDAILVTDSTDFVTPEWYCRLTDMHRCLVVVNPTKSSPLMFDGGQLPTPEKLVKALLIDLLGKGVDVDEFLQPVRGLSLKAIGELVVLTQARTGAATPKELRRTRGMISPAIQGFSPLDTSYDFYDVPLKLKEWLDLNTKYFVSPTVEQLIPRGLLLDGPPGTGKSMASKAIANQFGCPLFRLDVATVLDRYIGQSEARVARILSMCEREAPCVLLIDEVEKLFGDDGEAGVMSRILSQLLWWLSEHRSRVFTVMTTNDATKIPAELYRAGRLDATMHLPRMKVKEAAMFGVKAMNSILPKKPALEQTRKVSDAIKALGGDLSQIEVINLVIETIKKEQWL